MAKDGARAGQGRSRFFESTAKHEHVMISHKIAIHHGSSDGSLAIKPILLDASDAHSDGSLDGPPRMYMCPGS